MSEKKKLSYEEMESYSSNLFEQAKKLYKENTELKNMVKELSARRDLDEINTVLRVLDHKELFKQEFITKIVDRLEDMLTPQEPQEESKSETKED